MVVDAPEIKISRAYATANHWTFQIPPIKALLTEYVGPGIGWVDPFAGESDWAEYGNDMNLERSQTFHMDAEAFAKMMAEGVEKNVFRPFNGVLFDPPYSYRQVSEHYKAAGRKATQLDTSYNFYARVMEPLARAVKLNGYAISFGWNSNGFGKRRGFEKEEILLVAHGLHHNDTIVTVERKVRDGS